MKRPFFTLPSRCLLLAAPTLAQKTDPSSDTAEPMPATVRDARIFVANSMLMVKDLKIGVVQAFPELDPPGIRLTYSTRMDSEAQDITDEIECQVEPGSEPLKVTRFCMDLTCYAANSDEPEERRRFEEIRALMQRLT